MGGRRGNSDRMVVRHRDANIAQATSRALSCKILQVLKGTSSSSWQGRCPEKQAAGGQQAQQHCGITALAGPLI